MDFFVVGAIARDILFENFNGQTPRRETKDVDLAICVKNWAEYDRVVNELVKSGITGS